jgi:hypothetical protein
MSRVISRDIGTGVSQPPKYRYDGDFDSLRQHASNHMLILTQTGRQWSGGAWGVGESHLRGGVITLCSPWAHAVCQRGENEMLLAMRLVDSILRFRYPQRKPSYRS